MLDPTQHVDGQTLTRVFVDEVEHAKELRKWLGRTGVATLYIEPGSPWENGYCESFNSKLRDEFLNREIFYSLKEVQVLAERWRIYYNTERPHSSLGYRPPAPVAWQIEVPQGHGKVESKQPFPLFHAMFPEIFCQIISFGFHFIPLFFS